MLDIKEGDYLVVGGKDYPIRSCAEWVWGSGNGMSRFLRVTASTKRAPAITGGKRGEAVTNLTGVKCMNLDPVDPELRNRLELETPHELLQTVANGGGVFYRLILEDLKRG